jgi:hypothetical protein
MTIAKDARLDENFTCLNNYQMYLSQTTLRLKYSVQLVIDDGHLSWSVLHSLSIIQQPPVIIHLPQVIA